VNHKLNEMLLLVLLVPQILKKDSLLAQARKAEGGFGVWDVKVCQKLVSWHTYHTYDRIRIV
jgi:hypothetical protein